ncbi:MAG: glycosyltransferase family 4 protein [Acidobacteriota bacterium]
MARLLFLTGTPADVEGGSGTFVGISVLRRALQDLGHDVALLAPTPRAGHVSLPERLVFDWRAASRTRRDSAGLDAIVAFDMDGVFLARLSRLSSTPWIAAIKGTAAEEARYERGLPALRLRAEAFFEGMHVRGAAGVVAPSEHAAERIAAEYALPRRRIAVVPEPIDLARWTRALGEASGPPDGPYPSILCVAHLYPRKDIATLLDALARLPDARLRVVGSGPERGRLESRAHALGLGGRAVFLGHLPFARLAEEYRRASIFCLPSRQEAFGIVFLEAMAAGLPIVAARAAAVPELVAHEVSGRLVPPGDAAALASALAGLLSDPAAGRRFGEAGRRRVESFDAPLVAARFLDAIGLGAAGGGSPP